MRLLSESDLSGENTNPGTGDHSSPRIQRTTKESDVRTKCDTCKDLGDNSNLVRLVPFPSGFLGN